MKTAYLMSSQLLRVSLGCVLFIATALPAFGQSGFVGDYNGDDAISHADYTVALDTIASGSPSMLNDPTPGTVDQSDVLYYLAHFGETFGPPPDFPLGILPFEIVNTPTLDGNTLWTLTFSNVDGNLAGHLNITTDGPDFLSVVRGPSFSADLPGTSELAVAVNQEGIEFGSNMAFAAIGTDERDSLPSNATLDFLYLTTEGTEPTTLTYSGRYGNQAVEYEFSGIRSTFPEVPEPSSAGMLCTALACLLARRIRFKHQCEHAFSR